MKIIDKQVTRLVKTYLCTKVKEKDGGGGGRDEVCGLRGQ